MRIRAYHLTYAPCLAAASCRYRAYTTCTILSCCYTNWVQCRGSLALPHWQVPSQLGSRHRLNAITTECTEPVRISMYQFAMLPSNRVHQKPWPLVDSQQIIRGQAFSGIRCSQILARRSIESFYPSSPANLSKQLPTVFEDCSTGNEAARVKVQIRAHHLKVCQVIRPHERTAWVAVIDPCSH